MNEPLRITLSDAERPRDDQDLEGLVIAQGDTLDWGYCEQTAAELGEALGIDLVAKIRQLRRDRSSES